MKRWVRPGVAAADAATLIFLAVALRVLVVGGGRFRVAGLRISLISWWRPLLFALGLAVIRHLVVARPSLLARLRDGVRHLAGLARSEALGAAWRPFASSRVLVLLVGYVAVLTIGLAPRQAPWTLSENRLLNLPARYDAGWYLTIATEGYQSGSTGRQRNIAFFPAYPMLARAAAGAVGCHPAAAAFLIALGAFLWALVYLYRLARLFAGEEQARAALVLLAFYPFAVYFSAIYTESLFLLGVVAAFYHLERGEPLKAAPWGLLVGLARPNGFLLSLPLAAVPLAALLSRGGTRRTAPPLGRRPWEIVALLMAIAMPVVGLALYSAFVYSLTGDPLAWMKAHAAWGRTAGALGHLLSERWKHIAAFGLGDYLSAYPVEVMDAAALLFALGAMLPVARRLGAAYALFVAVNVIPPLVMGGMLSLGRLTSVMFPTFLWLGSTLAAERRAYWVAWFAGGQALVAALFFTWRPPY